MRNILPRHRESVLLLRHERANRPPWTYRHAKPGWQVIDSSGEVIAYVAEKVDAQLIVDYRNELPDVLYKIEAVRKQLSGLSRQWHQLMVYAWRSGFYVEREKLHAVPPLNRAEAEALARMNVAHRAAIQSETEQPR